MVFEEQCFARKESCVCFERKIYWDDIIPLALSPHLFFLRETINLY